MFRSNMISYTVVKIAIFTGVVFLLQLAAGNYVQLFALDPYSIRHHGFLWQFVTYIFLHANGLHLLANMYLLVMFGMQVEEAMGSGRMWFYFFFCGIGAGLIIFIVGYLQLINSGVRVSTIGASGAVFAILVAFAFYYPDAEILLFFVLPVKSKYLVFFYIALELYFFMTRSGGNVSYIGHLGGIVFALLYFLIWGRSSRGMVSKVKEKVHKEKIAKYHKQKAQEEDERKKEILKKIISGASLSDLTDDEYQLIMHYNVIYDDSIDVNNSIVEEETVSDHQFISLIRKITQDENLS